MRLNQFVALSTGMSRRAADNIIAKGQILINNSVGQLGLQVNINSDIVKLDNKILKLPNESTIVMLNKPIGYVCSRNGQGCRTIYDLLPEKHHILKSVGRLDKNSSGLLLLTNDGSSTHKLTHPSFKKEKIYLIKLNRNLDDADFDKIAKGVELNDGPSHLSLSSIDNDHTKWKVTMREGRNRQIRRTFKALNYNVIELHRTHFGQYALGNLTMGKFKDIST